VINAMIEDVTAESRRRIAALAPNDVADIRAAAAPVIGFSEEMRTVNRAVKSFLFTKMYRHWRVNRMTHKAQMVTRELATLLLARPDLLPGHWGERAGAGNTPQAAGIVRDYIAGMTDRFAMEEYSRLTDPMVPA
jgi:dGTPase